MRITKTTCLIAVVALVIGGAALLLVRGGNEVHAGGGDPEIILYSLPEFQGHELRLRKSEVDLPVRELADGSKILLNDSIRSIVVVSGTWRLYQHGRMNTAIDKTPRSRLNVAAMRAVKGWSTVVSATSRGPLRISAVELAGVGTDVSSVQLISTQNLPDWMYYERR